MENKNKTETPSKNEDGVSLPGKYKIIKTLGQGSFAKVKLARHTSTNLQVAIKIIDRTRLNADHFKKLKREIDLMKRIVHPNVIQLFEVIEDKKYIYLVLEYAHGGEIFDYLVATGRLKEKEARIKFRQIITAVQYCHQKGVVHRDLKAENLLLDESEEIKLADFGFANEFQEGCLLSTFCGSPPYAAPELFLGVKYDGPKVDVWSLGVILYTLVSGALPFDGSNIRELKDKILRCRYKIPFFMSTDCELLLKKMIVFNPKIRSSLEDIMKNKWVNIGFENCPLKPYKDDSINNIDEIRVEIMENMGFLKDDVIDSVSNKRFNHTYATYMLLNKFATRKISKKSSTQSDVQSEAPAVSTLSGQNESLHSNQKANFQEPTQPSGSMFGKFMNVLSSTVGNVMRLVSADSHQTNRTPNLEGSDTKHSSAKPVLISKTSDGPLTSKPDSIKQRPKLNLTSQVHRRHTASNKPSLILSPVTHSISEQTRRRLYSSTKQEQKKPRQVTDIKNIDDNVKLPGNKSVKKNLHLISEVAPETTLQSKRKISDPTPGQTQIIQEITIVKEPTRLHLQKSN